MSEPDVEANPRASAPAPKGHASIFVRLSARVMPAVEWCGDNLFLCWAWSTTVMFVLACISVLMGIHSVRFSGALDIPWRVPFPHHAGHFDKEVGFLFAPNWSLYGCIIIPLMVVFCLRTWTAMSETLHAVGEAGMARGHEFQQMSPEILAAQWARALRRYQLIFVVIFVATLAFVAHDWWSVVGHPLVDPRVLNKVLLTDPSMEFDWSIACRFAETHVNCFGLGLFGGLAYLLIPGAMCAAAFATCVCSVLFVSFMCGYDSRRADGWRLVAMPRQERDHRAGFGHFSAFFNALLGLSICVVVGCLLMIVQNAYLRDGDSADILSFVFGDITALATQMGRSSLGDVANWKWVVWLLHPAANMYANPQTGIGVLLFALTATIAIGTSWGLLRNNAQVAQACSYEHAAMLAPECGVSPRVFKRRLDNMDFWPVGWMSEGRLLVTMVGLLACVASYRLMLLPLALLSIQGGQAIFDALRSGDRRHVIDRGPDEDGDEES